MTVAAQRRSPAGPVAVVSHTLPGELNGQAVMLDRLTGGPAAPGFVLLDTDRKAGRRTPRAAGPRSHPLPTPYLLRKMFRVDSLHRRLFELLVWQRSRAIAGVVRRHRCRSILGCTGGDLIDLPAAVEAGRLTGVPVYLYYFDDYRVQWVIAGGRWSRQVTARLRERAESMVFERAAGVIAPNEILADDLRARTSLPVIVVRNPVDTAAYGRLREAFPRAARSPARPVRIVYTGSVYAAQADSLRRLCEAIDLLASRGIRAELHIYGHQPDAEVRGSLPAEGIVFHPPVSPADSAEIQVRADLLFLPLSFDCGYPELIRTSAPGKFGEYLASGTPLLVHAPAGSFPVEFVTRRGCGVACSTPAAAALAAELARLIDDSAGCRAMAAKAVVAAGDFNADLNRRRLSDFLTAPRAGSAVAARPEELRPAA